MQNIILLEPLTNIPLSSQLDKYLKDNTDLYPHSHWEWLGKRFLKETTSGQMFVTRSQAEEQEAKYLKLEAKRRLEEEVKHKYDYIDYPFIDKNNSDRWAKGMKHLSDGNQVEMCEDSFYWFMKCVPPTLMSGPGYVCGEPYTHKGGEAVYLCAIHVNGKYYAKHGTVKEFKSNQLFKV